MSEEWRGGEGELGGLEEREGELGGLEERGGGARRPGGEGRGS